MQLKWPDITFPPLNLYNYKQWDKTMYKNDEAMNFELQNYQLDMNWLSGRAPKATEKQIDDFIHKVSHAVQDNPSKSIDEIRATVYRVMGF